MAQLRLSHQDHSRTKLLNRLGLFQQPQMSRPPRPTRASTSSMGHSIVLGDARPVKAQLKGIGGSVLSEPASISTPTVQFNPTVSMIQIPSRYQYSPRIKKSIWSDGYELKENAERNLIEFEAEGFDWRNVVLDDDMYIDSYNGHLIHPCHVNDFSKEDDFDHEDPFDGFQSLQKRSSTSFFHDDQKL